MNYGRFLTFAFLVSVLNTACGSSLANGPPPVPPSAIAGGVSDPSLDLATLAPEGASFILVAHPTALFAEAALFPVLDLLFSPAGLDAFTERNRIDPRDIRTLVYARYANGVDLVLAEGPIDARAVVVHAGERMPIQDGSEDSPLTRRSGFVSRDRIDVVALDSHRIAMARRGSSPLVRVIGCVVEHRDCAGALLQHEASSLYEANKQANMMLVVPDPLGLPTDTGIGRIFAGERALEVHAEPASAAGLHLVVNAAGDFPDTISENIRTFLRNFAQTDLAQVFGLEAALGTLEVSPGEHTLHAAITLQLEQVRKGLTEIFAPDLHELLSR